MKSPFCLLIRTPGIEFRKSRVLENIVTLSFKETVSRKSGNFFSCSRTLLVSHNFIQFTMFVSLTWSVLKDNVNKTWLGLKGLKVRRSPFYLGGRGIVTIVGICQALRKSWITPASLPKIRFDEPLHCGISAVFRVYHIASTSFSGYR